MGRGTRSLTPPHTHTHTHSHTHTHTHTHTRSNQLEKVPNAVITDPTLGREAVECPKCARHGAVYLMPKISAADERIKLIFVCTNAECVHKWQA